MSRNILDDSHIHPAIRATIDGAHRGLVDAVRQAVAGNDIVVVGMAMNPFPKKARKLLEAAQLPYKYLEYGSYFKDWRPRTALKMWTGWSTFPMIFVKGVLVGGADDLGKLLASGELQRMLAAKNDSQL